MENKTTQTKGKEMRVGKEQIEKKARNMGVKIDWLSTRLHNCLAVKYNGETITINQAAERLFGFGTRVEYYL